MSLWCLTRRRFSYINYHFPVMSDGVMQHCRFSGCHMCIIYFMSSPCYLVLSLLLRTLLFECLLLRAFCKLFYPTTFPFLTSVFNDMEFDLNWIKFLSIESSRHINFTKFSDEERGCVKSPNFWSNLPKRLNLKCSHSASHTQTLDTSFQIACLPVERIICLRYKLSDKQI